MITVPVYNQTGKEIEKLKLSDAIFNTTVKAGLLHEAVRFYLANRHQSSAHTKSKAEVRGGGKKPWRQKGTGRARHGSIRSPLWRGGGITFGPRNTKNYALKMNIQAQQRAVAMALSDKVKQKKFIVLDALSLEKGKTKELLSILKKLPAMRTSLFVVGKNHAGIVRASRNSSSMHVAAPHSLNAYDVIVHDGMIVTKDAVALIQKRLTRLK